MTTDTLWTQMRPFDRAMRSVDPDSGFPGALAEGDRATVILSDFSAVDWLTLPDETPAFDGRGLHPLAGQRLRVVRWFRGHHPATGEGLVWHAVTREGDVAVAETVDGFIVYQASTYPEDWPRRSERVRGVAGTVLDVPHG